MLLLTQLMVAAYACPLLLAEPPSAVPAAMVDPFGGVIPPDFGLGTGAGEPAIWMDSASPNLCGEHCKVGQQSDQASAIHVPAPLLALRYVIPPAPPVPSPARPASAELISALVAAAPPHAILHCVLRT